jgi:peptidoglycan/xylan/chitin deacetylase (PgdA/CDA1 family)
LFSSNRRYHREFWDWVEEEVHYEHLEKSQRILQDYFEDSVTTLVPPGNVFCRATVKAAERCGIKRINCLSKSGIEGGVEIIGQEDVFAFHDREIVLYSVDWLRERLDKNGDVKYCFVSQL